MSAKRNPGHGRAKLSYEDAEMLRQQKEQQRKEDMALQQLKALRDGFAKKSGFTPEETDAVLYYLFRLPDISLQLRRAHLYIMEIPFTKHTLLCLKAINRFATDNKIRFEDAVVVLTEYASVSV